MPNKFNAGLGLNSAKYKSHLLKTYNARSEARSMERRANRVREQQDRPRAQEQQLSPRAKAAVWTFAAAAVALWGAFVAYFLTRTKD